MKKKKRIEWIDTLRGIAMFFTIWGHAYPDATGLIRKYIYSFHMPLFFFISGLTYNSNKLSFKDFIKKRMKTLLIPYLIINLISIFIYFLFSKFAIVSELSIIQMLMGIFYSNTEYVSAPAGPTWFMLTLLLVEILFYGLKKISKDDSHLFTNVMWISLVGFINTMTKWEFDAPWHLNTVPMGLVLYFVGYIFIKKFSKFKNIFNDKKKMFFYGLILGFVGALTAVLNGRISMHANNYGSIILYYTSVLSTIFGLVLFVNLFMKKSILFKRIGENTLFYLGYHMWIIRLAFAFIPSVTDNSLNVLVLGITTTLIMYPIARLVYKYIPIIVGKVNIKRLN